jgi:lipopolysaccharide export system permease protein
VQVVIKNVDADGESVTHLSRSIEAIRAAGFSTGEIDGRGGTSSAGRFQPC